jgi:hypothetical protein
LKLRDIFDVKGLREQVELRCLTVKALRGVQSVHPNPAIHTTQSEFRFSDRSVC